MIDSPLVSVPILTYNHENYIEECIESVFAQKTNFPFEVIVGEDCSTDNTREILKRLERKYEGRLLVIYQEKNVGFMRNGFEFCFPKIRGKYIACLDGDDYWVDENKLQMQVDILEKDPSASICFTDIKVWDEYESRFHPNPNLKYIHKDRFGFLDILDLNVISTSSVLFKNIFTTGLPKNFLRFPFGDWPMFLFALLHGDAVFLNQVTAVYRHHSGGVYIPLNIDQRIFLNFEIYQLMLQFPEFEKYFKHIKNLLSDKAYYYMCMELQKEKPDRSNIKKSNYYATKNFNLKNFNFPVRSFIRSNLFLLSGGLIGRKPPGK